MADATAEDYATAFVINLSSGKKDEGNLVLSEDEATCVAPRLVDAIGVQTFQDTDVTPDDIEQPRLRRAPCSTSARSVGEEIVRGRSAACNVDIVALFAESLTAGLTAEQQSCVAENVDAKQVEALLVKTFSTGESDTEFEAVIEDLTQKCDCRADPALARPLRSGCQRSSVGCRTSQRWISSPRPCGTGSPPRSPRPPTHRSRGGRPSPPASTR